MANPVHRRGVGAKQLVVLGALRQLLRARVEPEKMLRDVTRLLAEQIGQYAICDAFDPTGRVRRLVAAHADPARIRRVLAAVDQTRSGRRVEALLAHGGAERVAEVSAEEAETHLADIDFLERERVRSYVAQTVHVNGSPFAVLTLLVTVGARRYEDDDSRFLEVVADWTGLGLENALRREAEPRFTTPIPGTLHVVDAATLARKKRVTR